MKTAHVLWTGGWDSTYRVLDLALAQGVKVQPHYLLDSERESRFSEQAAIGAIRSSARDRGGLIEPVRTFAIEELKISADLAEKHRGLRERFHIGPQYLWLAQYANQKGMPNLELCIHRDDRASGIFEYLQSARKNGRESSADEVIDPDHLFSAFVFPILDLTKKQMLYWARVHGFDDLMELTWFCHRPTRSGKPCGICNPCRWTINEGLWHRLPFAARVRNRLDKRVVAGIPSFRLKRGIRALLRRVG